MNHSNIDEDSIKESLLKEKATPTEVSKSLAELKSNKISQKFTNEIVLGADSVIDLKGKIISKPNNRMRHLKILKETKWRNTSINKLSLHIKNGSMIWNYTDKASLTMKNMTFKELNRYT